MPTIQRYSKVYRRHGGSLKVVLVPFKKFVYNSNVHCTLLPSIVCWIVDLYLKEILLYYLLVCCIYWYSWFYCGVHCILFWFVQIFWCFKYSSNITFSTFIFNSKVRYLKFFNIWGEVNVWKYWRCCVVILPKMADFPCLCKVQRPVICMQVIIGSARRHDGSQPWVHQCVRNIFNYLLGGAVGAHVSMWRIACF